MSFSLEEEKLGSFQEHSSFWEFIATSLGRNKEGGGMYSGLGLPRSPTDCNGLQGGYKKTILCVHKDIDFASTICNKSNKHEGTVDSELISRHWTMVTDYSLKEAGTYKQDRRPTAQHLCLGISSSIPLSPHNG